MSSKNKVEFTISESYTFNKCRACGMKALLFGVIQSNEEYDDISFRLWLQAPSDYYKLYCPYCGKREMWKEDE